MMMILWTLACGIGQREECRVAKSQALSDWEQVSDYYDRMASLEEPRLAETEAQVTAMGKEVEKAERRRRRAQNNRNTGLIDLRDGSELIDAQASAAMSVEQGRAKRARDESADAQAKATLERIEIADHLEELRLSAELSRSIHAALRAGPWSLAMERLSESTQLRDTELIGIAVQASEKAQGLCKEF